MMTETELKVWNEDMPKALTEIAKRADGSLQRVVGRVWLSKAEWPKGSICQSRANEITTDEHATEAQARAVCRMLERDGRDGEGKTFPVRTWVEDTSNIPDITK
jgi:hypothetical protein